VQTDIVNHHNVGPVIRELRRRRGRTQQQFAEEALGDPAAQSYVSKWERGLIQPNLASLQRIAEWARVSLAVFGMEDAKTGLTQADVVELRRLAKRILEIVGE
jgi:transcriptional regulator with XRE-family HTH domain